MAKKIYKLNKDIGVPLGSLYEKSPYAVFLLVQLQQQLQKALVEQERHDPLLQDGQKNFCEHPLPLENQNFRYMPFKISRQKELLDKEYEDLSVWVAGGGSTEEFHDKRREYYSTKHSMVLKKIITMAQDFAECIARIGTDMRIPFESMLILFNVITAPPEHHKIPWTYTVPQPLLPKAIPEHERDSFWVAVSDKIHNLLLECLWSMYFVGFCDYYDLYQFFYEHQDDPKAIKEYLHAEAPFLIYEDIIGALDTPEELKAYIGYQYSFCRDVLDLIRIVLIKRIKYYGGHKKRYMDIPLKYSDDNVATPQLHDSFDQTIASEPESFYDDSEIQSILDEPEDLSIDLLYESDDIDEQYIHEIEFIEFINEEATRHFSGTGYEDVAPVLSGTGKRTQRFTNGEIRGFRNQIEDFVLQRIVYGFIMGRNLSGNPVHIIGYIYKEVLRSTFSAIEKHYHSPKTKAQFGRNARTVKGIEKKIRRNKSKLGSEYAQQEVTISDIEKEIRRRDDKKRHIQEGYLTQRALIKELQDPETRAFLARKKIIIPSADRILRERLTQLINEDKLNPESYADTAMQYKVGYTVAEKRTAITEIARLIMSIRKPHPTKKDRA